MSCKDREDAHEEKSQKLDSLSQALQTKKAEVDSLKRRIEKDSNQKAAYPVMFGKEFSHIEDPEKYIKRELQKNKKDFERSAWGTMYRGEIQVLSDK